MITRVFSCAVMLQMWLLPLQHRCFTQNMAAHMAVLQDSTHTDPFHG